MKIIGGTVLKNSGSKFMVGKQKYHFCILLTFFKALIKFKAFCFTWILRKKQTAEFNICRL